MIVMCPNGGDATSFYRGLGPLCHLQKQIREESDDRLEMLLVSSFVWESMSMTDVLFMQRPYTDSHLKVAQMARDMGVPIIVDYDDDLFSVPTDNPSHGLYMNTAVHKNIAMIVALSSHVMVSTGALKARLTKLNQNITIVPNAFNEKLFFWRNEVNMMRQKIVFWRGSASHARDVASFSHEMIDLGNARPDWVWNFVGSNPWFATDFMPTKTTIVCPPMEIVDYHKFLHKTRPAITVVPLHNSGFNLCKSNIAWMEGIFAGSVVVAPNWEEWRVPGVHTYETPDEFEEVIGTLMDRFNSAGGRRELLEENRTAWAYINENLSLKKVNQLRWNIIKQVAGQEPLLPEGI